jgi:hypothetical protein
MPDGTARKSHLHFVAVGIYYRDRPFEGRGNDGKN